MLPYGQHNLNLCWDKRPQKWAFSPVMGAFSPVMRAFRPVLEPLTPPQGGGHHHRQTDRHTNFLYVYISMILMEQKNYCI